MKKRYPLEPLLELAGWNITRVHEVDPCNGPEYRVRKERGVTERVADRLATAAGYHPSEIWPEWLDDSIEDVERPCHECEQRFVPIQPTQRFCRPQCRKNWNVRRYRKTTKGAARNRATARQYYHEHRDYCLARQHRYDAERREGAA